MTTVVKGDCQALLALYNATGGHQWTTKTGWGVNTNPCNWFGVGCRREPGDLPRFGAGLQ